MKQLLCAAALCLSSSFAAALPQGETIGIYFDPAATQTTIQVEPMEFFQVYFIAQNVPSGVAGYEFTVNVPPELIITATATHPIGYSIDIDSTNEGFIVGCGQCLNGPGPIILAEITCMGLGTATGLQLTLGPANPSSFGGLSPGYCECVTYELYPFADAYSGPAIVDIGAGSAYCFCDGSGTASPCGNIGESGHGCANSTFSWGARLHATGDSSISGGAFVLHGTSATPNQAGLFFQGINAVNGGSGTIFGDGLRCAGGSVKRLQVRFFDGAGSGSTTIDIATKGDVAPGDVRYYQLWYRDPGSSPCNSEFNASNGLEVTWSS